MTNKWTLNFDGGWRATQGVGGWGAVIRSDEGREVRLNGAERNTTMNIMEYTGLVKGLECAATVLGLENTSLTIIGDSQLVIYQMSGEYKIRKAHLVPLNRRAQVLIDTLIDRGVTIHYKWVPRAENGDADAEANIAMDGAKKSSGIISSTTRVEMPKGYVTEQKASEADAVETIVAALQAFARRNGIRVSIPRMHTLARKALRGLEAEGTF